MNLSHAKKRSTERFLLILTLALCAPAVLMAGGYLAVDTNGTPYKWTGPITVHLDQGPLGKLTKAQADALALDAMDHWTSNNIPGSTVQFVRGPDLVEDHGDGLGTDPNNEFTSPPVAQTDGITAIIYDQTGAILESVYGANQANAVAGAAGPVIPDARTPAPLVEGVAIINGRMYDDAPDEIFPNDLPYDQFEGAFIHEIGHMLNLDHAQAAIAFSETGFDYGSIGGPSTPRRTPDYRGVPTMFPFVMPMMNTLETDDKAWLLELYADAATKAATGSIGGAVQNFDGTAANGINIVAYSADDPTSMITCVSGYIDPYLTNTPTGIYKIPRLPAGSKWVLDAEPVLGIFTGGSSVGPEDPPAVMNGAPEFLNETGYESTTDSAIVSTTFDISPTDDSQRDVTGVNLRMSDLNDVDLVAEVDAGADDTNAQLLTITPGKFCYVSGTADPNEPGIQNIIYGSFGDFFYVDAPAGLQLEQVFIDPGTDIVDLYLFEKLQDGDIHYINGTTSGYGGNATEYMMDYSHMGAAAGYGQYYFGVGYPIQLLGGSANPTITNYTFGLLFSVSDRDPVVVKGIQSGELDPNATTIRVLGRGFKNVGGVPPSVSFSTSDITANNVTFIDENNLDVNITTAPTLPVGINFTMQVTNAAQSGGYAGRHVEKVEGTPAGVPDWGIY